MPKPSASVRDTIAIRRMYENGANVNQICRKLDLTKHTVQSLIDKWFPEDKEPEPAPKAETTKEVTKPRAAKVKAADEFS